MAAHSLGRGDGISPFYDPQKGVLFAWEIGDVCVYIYIERERVCVCPNQCIDKFKTLFSEFLRCHMGVFSCTQLTSAWLVNACFTLHILWQSLGFDDLNLIYVTERLALHLAKP